MLPLPRASRASTTPLRGPAWLGGAPEVSSGVPSPPSSPPLAARTTSAAKNSGRARRGGAAYTITGECERLFCETLRAVFLGEGSQQRQDSLVTGMHTTQPALDNDYGVKADTYTDRMVNSRSPSPVPMPVGFAHDDEKSTISGWIEMWDYVGGIRFRGFVAENEDEKAMFVFFDQSVVGGDLKAGLMALLELCEVDYFSCDRLVVCIDRHTDKLARDTLTKDLGWIGFSLTTLDDFSENGEITSDKWLFMDMEV